MTGLFDIIGPKPRETPKTPAERAANYFTSIARYLSLGSPAVTSLSRKFDHAPPSTFIAILGLDGAGKRTLLREHLASHPEDIQTVMPTIGISLTEVEAGPILFQTHDIGGCQPDTSKRFEREFFKRADAVIWVVDAADRDRAMESREELMLNGLLAGRGGMKQGIPVLILATKVDIENARRPDQLEILFIENISTSIADRPAHVAGTNLLTGEGLEDAFSWLSDALRNKPPKDDLIDEKHEKQ